MAENHQPEPGDRSAMFELIAKGSKKMYEYLLENDYTAVIATHVFASMMLTRVREKYGLNIKQAFVSTDYTCYPGVPECDIDNVFMAHEDVRNEYIENGVSEKALSVSGIPIKQAFFKDYDKDSARKHLGLPLNKTIVLLACGSMGCGPIKELAEQVLHEGNPDLMAVAICGNNKKLYAKLTDVAAKNYDLRVEGFTTEMPLFMAAADLIVTKPGGLSSTEAATMGLPMVFVNAVPGCETHNLNFFVKRGFAETSDSVEGLVKLVKKLAGDKELREQISARLHENFRNNGAEIICDTVTK